MSSSSSTIKTFAIAYQISLRPDHCRGGGLVNGPYPSGEEAREEGNGPPFEPLPSPRVDRAQGCAASRGSGRSRCVAAVESCPFRARIRLAVSTRPEPDGHPGGEGGVRKGVALGQRGDGLGALASEARSASIAAGKMSRPSEYSSVNSTAPFTSITTQPRPRSASGRRRRGRLRPRPRQRRLSPAQPGAVPWTRARRRARRSSATRPRGRCAERRRRPVRPATTSLRSWPSGGISSWTRTPWRRNHGRVESPRGRP